MHRRSFIQKTTVTTLAAFLPGGLLSANLETSWRTYAHPDLLRIIGDEREVAEIGKAYRRLNPQHATPKSLGVAIQASVSHPLSEQVGVDFLEGSTIQLNGWVLSLTEARQCALYSFLYS